MSVNTDLHGVCESFALRSTPPSQAKTKVVPSESSYVRSLDRSQSHVWPVDCLFCATPSGERNKGYRYSSRRREDR